MKRLINSTAVQDHVHSTFRHRCDDCKKIHVGKHFRCFRRPDIYRELIVCSKCSVKYADRNDDESLRFFYGLNYGPVVQRGLLKKRYEVIQNDGKSKPETKKRVPIFPPRT